MKSILFSTCCLFSTWLSAQNVGLGTTTPEARLHIRSTGWIKAILENDADQPRGYIGADNNGTITLAANAYWNGSTWIYPNAGASFYMLLHRVNNQFEFRVRPDGGSQNTAMVINQNGNVGIGTGSPQQRLDINGAIRIGNTNTNSAGTLRFNNNQFEGFNGTEWKRFEQLPIGTLITSPTAENAALTASGYSFAGGIPNVITRTAVTQQITANTWLTAGKLAYRMIGVTGHTAVWGNNKMHIWGGGDREDNPASFPFTNTFAWGASYQPQTNYWDSISPVNAPSHRMNHTAVWTGQSMIIWGGRSSNNDGTFTARNDGKEWKESGNNWTTLSTPSLTARYNHSAVWTGTEMIVWGGQSNSTTTLNTGARWNGSNWIPISTINAPTARRNHTAIWTGTSMIIWGGADASGSNMYSSGAIYTPATNTWTTMSTVTISAAGRLDHTAVWTGTEMILWGGNSFGSNLNSGVRYNPASDTWTNVAVTNGPGARRQHSAVWTGTEMLIFGGNNAGADLNSGGKYNPTLNTWTALPQATVLDEGSPTSKMAAVWTGQQMVLFGGTNSNGSIWSDICLRFFPQAQTLNSFVESTKTIFLFEKN